MDDIFALERGYLDRIRRNSWLGQFQRVQRLAADHLLIVQADVQLTPDSLFPSQQFVIGGGQLLRGYRQNARSKIASRFNALKRAHQFYKLRRLLIWGRFGIDRTIRTYSPISDFLQEAESV